MSTCHFNYDFFQDGRSDALSEVRILQHHGQWTKEKRASWTKEAQACRLRLKQAYPSMHEGASYFAGRVAALKSRLTADFSEEEPACEQTGDALIYRPLPPNADRFCGLFDCGDEALWGVSFGGDAQSFLLLCDCCRQEWQRSETAYTTEDGWDWQEDEEMSPLPMRVQTKRAALRDEALALGPVVLPLATLVGFDLSNILSPASHSTMFGELCIVALVGWQSKNITRLLFFFKNETKGEGS